MALGIKSFTQLKVTAFEPPNTLTFFSFFVYYFHPDFSWIFGSVHISLDESIRQDGKFVYTLPLDEKKDLPL